MSISNVPGVVVTSTDDANLGGAASFDLNDVSVGHVINGDLTNTSNAPITVTYSVTPKLAGCATGTAVPTTVIVYPKPNVVATNNIPVFPTGAATDILLTGDVAGTLFGWRVLNPGTSGAFNDGGVAIGGSITQTLPNSGAAPITVTYRIGPAANGCLGDSVDVTVQIDPNVDVTLVNNAPFLCTGGLTDIDISSSVTGVTFEWVVLNAGATGATDGNGGPNTAVESVAGGYWHSLSWTLHNHSTPLRMPAWEILFKAVEILAEEIGGLKNADEYLLHLTDTYWREARKAAQDHATATGKPVSRPETFFVSEPVLRVMQPFIEEKQRIAGARTMAPVAATV